jgi:hypothetical protein
MFLLVFLIHVQIGCSKRPYLPNTGSKFKVAKERCKENKLTITWGKTFVKMWDENENYTGLFGSLSLTTGKSQ